MNALTSKSSFGRAATGLMAVAALTTALTLAPANDVEAQQPVQIAQSVQFKANPAHGGDNIITRAADYSKGREVIGIAITAGPDIPPHVTLQQVGERVQQELTKFGVKSEYFVEKNPKPDAGGTTVRYMIDGNSWSKNAISYRESIGQARNVATDALFTFSHNKTKTLAALQH